MSLTSLVIFIKKALIESVFSETRKQLKQKCKWETTLNFSTKNQTNN